MEAVIRRKVDYSSTVVFFITSNSYSLLSFFIPEKGYAFQNKHRIQHILTFSTPRWILKCSQDQGLDFLPLNNNDTLTDPEPQVSPALHGNWKFKSVEFYLLLALLRLRSRMMDVYGISGSFIIFCFWEHLKMARQSDLFPTPTSLNKGPEQRLGNDLTGPGRKWMAFFLLSPQVWLHPEKKNFDGLLYSGFIWTGEGKAKGSNQKPIKSQTQKQGRIAC